MQQIALAVICGTGVSNLAMLDDVQTSAVQTRFGRPSRSGCVGTLLGNPVAFLARPGDRLSPAPHHVNYRPHSAALRRTRAHRVLALTPDLVLMDVMMPEMDGHEATRLIRQQPRWRKLPIIAVTAKAMKDDQHRCLQAGANDYLAKPIDLDRLFSLIRVWLPQLERI